MKIKNFLITSLVVVALITGCSKSVVGPVSQSNTLTDEQLYTTACGQVKEMILYFCMPGEQEMTTVSFCPYTDSLVQVNREQSYVDGYGITHTAISIRGTVLISVNMLTGGEVRIFAYAGDLVNNSLSETLNYKTFTYLP
jgi:hypothetical protein